MKCQKINNNIVIDVLPTGEYITYDVDDYTLHKHPSKIIPQGSITTPRIMFEAVIKWFPPQKAFTKLAELKMLKL